MQVSQKVVCIDDSFPKPLAKHYTQLPVKGKTYTVRAVYVARGVMAPIRPGYSDGQVGILLQELHNPPDPGHKGHNELGFNSERFKPLEELTTDTSEPQEQEDYVGQPLTFTPNNPYENT